MSDTSGSLEFSEASQLARVLTMNVPSHHFFERRMVSPTGYVKQVFREFKTLRENPELWESEIFPSSLNRRGEVYFSIATRTRRAGTADAIGLGLAIWADMDDEDAQHAFPIPPSAVVQTSPPRHKHHLYWFLDEPTSNMELLLRINRSIPNADLNAIDKARVLRAPGYSNLKYDSPPMATLLRLDSDRRYSIEALTEAFPPVPMESRRVSNSDRKAAPTWLGLVFDAIVDFLELGDFHPQARGAEGAVMALCPLHEDTNRSLSLHPTRGYYCFGCRSGGRLSRLANLLGVRV
jgi:hypothetical protein